MTAPEVLDDRPDPQVTYALDGLPFGEYDPDGCWWIVRSTKGWHDPVEVRGTLDAFPDGPGGVDGPAFAEPRLIVLNMTVLCPDARARNAARDRFNGVAADPRRLYELRMTDQHHDVRTADVRRSGSSKFELAGERRAEAQLSLRAPDPRKHAGQWQQPFATAPTVGILGADFAGGGLDFAGAGLDFGTPEQPYAAAVVNLGTAPAHPLFTLTGPLTRPAVVHVETGRVYQMYGDVAAGETVWINAAGFAQRGIPRHARLSSTRGHVGALIPIVDQWPRVDPYTTATFALRGSGTGTAGMQVALRSAWY